MPDDKRKDRSTYVDAIRKLKAIVLSLEDGASTKIQAGGKTMLVVRSGEYYLSCLENGSKHGMYLNYESVVKAMRDFQGSAHEQETPSLHNSLRDNSLEVTPDKEGYR